MGVLWHGSAVVMFQSLFWWIGDGGLRQSIVAQQTEISFNPCSGGLEMAADDAAPEVHAHGRVSILVLVDWRWRLRNGELNHARARRFQSLFWWIGDGGCPTSVMAAPVTGFQSLFWWIGDGGWYPIMAIAGGRSSFNPCSGGLEMAAH